MPQVNAYVFFDGTCAEAMRFYERTLGGKMEMMMTHAEAPKVPNAPPSPPGAADRIMHASLTIDGGGTLMASDSMVGQPYGGMKGFSLSLAYKTVAEGKRIFDALAAEGPGDHALCQDVLGRRLRYACRPLRHAVDDQRGNGWQVTPRAFVTTPAVVTAHHSAPLISAKSSRAS